MTQPTPQPNPMPSQANKKPNADLHAQAAESCDKAAEQHRHAAKSCLAGDDKKAGEHAKQANDHCVKAQDSVKQATTA